MDSVLLDIHTGAREVVLDLTSRCEQFVSGRGDGLLHVFVPHATAGVAILETGAGSDLDLLAVLATAGVAILETGAGSDLDLLAVLEDLLPRDFEWQHRHGSPGHGRDHVLPALVPPYATVPVLKGRLTLGTWQSICLVDTNRDNPDRRVRLSFLAG